MPLSSSKTSIDPRGRDCCYEGKRAAKTFLADHRREYGVPIELVRIFDTCRSRFDWQPRGLLNVELKGIIAYFHALLKIGGTQPRAPA